VNQGGEQEHDDYGLPRVDIEIPDDARELFRDVQAYHRELRAVRRQERSIRWRAPFRRTSLAVPLLAGCLIVALLAVMISAMLTANPLLDGQRPSGQPDAGGKSSAATSPGQPRATRSSPAISGPTAPAGAASKPAAKRLPGTSISVAGKPLPLRPLRSTALAIVPAKCRCAAAVERLLKQAELARVIVYLVAPPGTDLATLSRLASLVAGKATKIAIASDNKNVLDTAYPPVGLTVLLVDARGSVTEATEVGPQVDLEKQLRLLKSAG
jgi:hypothetical protein